MPTLRKWRRCTRSQTHLNRVRAKRTGKCVNSGLRSLTRKSAVETLLAGSAAGPKWIASVHANQRSVGKLTASDTRRVKLGAKCQWSGKENVASSQTPSFSGPRGRGKDIIDQHVSSKRPADIMSAGLFVYFFPGVRWFGMGWRGGAMALTPQEDGAASRRQSNSPDDQREGNV